ncbi:tetratricopeptide repeat protein [Bacillota bacterium Lsc_1132]
MSKDAKARIQNGKILTFLPNGEYYFKKGLKAYHRQDLTKAKKYLQRAMQLEPTEPMIACQLAIVLTEIGEYEDSNELLQHILEELDQEMVECHYFLANNYAYLGFFKDAFQHAKRYLELEPDGDFADDSEELLELLALESEELEEELYEEDDLIIKQERARDLLESGYFPKAIELLHSVINEYPEYWSAYNNLALAYFYLGKVEKAETILLDVLKRNPGNLHALCNLLVFAHYRKQTKKAVKLTKMLKKIQPLVTEHQFKLGATFALVGEFDLAYFWLKKLYKYGFAGDGPFYYWLSLAAYHTGNVVFAKNIWKKVIDINPEKIGLEPWNDEREGINGLEDHSQSISRKLESDYVEERLFSLFLISVSKKREEMLALVKMDKFTEIEKQYADYLMKQDSSFYWQGHEIAKNLYRYYQPIGTIEAGLFLTWFSIFLQAVNQGLDLNNTYAWAAATEYVWKKLRNEKRSQQELADRYGLSAATVGKYVKLVNNCLQ